MHAFKYNFIHDYYEAFKNHQLRRFIVITIKIVYRATGFRGAPSPGCYFHSQSGGFSDASGTDQTIIGETLLKGTLVSSNQCMTDFTIAGKAADVPVAKDSRRASFNSNTLLF